MARVFPVELIFKLEEKLGKEEAKEFMSAVEQALEELSILRKLELKDELTKELATKADIRDIKAEILEIKAELKAQMSTEISNLRTEINAEISGLKEQTNTEISSLRTEISNLRIEMASLREQMNTEVSGLRAQMNTEMSNLRTDLEKTRTELNVRIDKLEFYVKLMIGILILAIALYSPVFAELIRSLIK